MKYKIITKNWHYSKNAEIDIIAMESKTIVFVEVKTRSDGMKYSPSEIPVISFLSSTINMFMFFCLNFN